MKPEEKVPSLELCRKLWDLGITKGMETERVWFRRVESGNKWRIVLDCPYPANGHHILPAPDLSEFGGLLPDHYVSGSYRDYDNLPRTYYCFYPSAINPDIEIEANTEPNARAEMAIALYETREVKK